MDFLNGDGVLSLTGSDGIVRTSGNQTIRGVKTFKDTLIEEGTIQCSRLDANFIFSKTPADFLVIQSNTSTAWTAGTTFAATAEEYMNLTSNTDNINLTTGLALQHNSQTFNPRRQYSLDYTNGSTVLYYGVEIIRAANDPNNVLSPAPGNGKTYVEIFANSTFAAGYNPSRLNGYFIGGGNSDVLNQTDFLCSTYSYLEPTFGPIMSGFSSANYTSFVFYLIGGLNYRIITDGVVGNYWNNTTTAPNFERWVLTNNTTYNTGQTSTFAIVKNLNGTDFIGTTASVDTLAFPALFLDANIWEYNTARRNRFKITDSKIIAPEQYIAAAGSTTAVPVVSFTKIGIKNGGTSNSNINWGLDTVNVSLLASIPFKCRCVAIDVVFDNDATPPTVDVYFKVYLGNSTTIGDSDYFASGNGIRIDVGQLGANGWTDGIQTLSQPTIGAGTQFFGSWECRSVATNALTTLNQEFIITFYFQQLPA